MSCPREPVGVHVIMSGDLSASTFSWRVTRVDAVLIVENVRRDDAAGLLDGSAVVVHCRSVERRPSRDVAAFEAAGRA
jgi:hypothetical protein